MAGMLHTALWLGWAFACALLTRIGLTRILQRRLGAMAQFAAYGFWFVLLAVGLLLVGLSGMQMYGFDDNDPWQVAGYFVLFYSPLGLPTAVGAPAVLLVDAALAGASLLKRRRIADVIPSRTR